MPAPASVNRLSTDRRVEVVRALVEGVSIRGTARITGVSKPTILKLIADRGFACSLFQDARLRNLPCRRIQCDEIWAFCHTKKKNLPPELHRKFGVGDVWTWVAMDPDTKLVPCWLLGPRDGTSARMFMQDLADRLLHRVQLTTDGYEPYVEAAYGAFGEDVDFAMVVKDFGEGRSVKNTISGDPDPDHVSTSLIERQNLTMRMGMRRFTRKTNGFSKKLENHAHAVALHFMYYNFARPHDGAGNVSPAQAVGISDHLWKISEIVGLIP